MNHRILKPVAAVLLVSMGMTSLPVQAITITTEEAVQMSAPAMTGREALTDLLARADVQAELARLGVDPALAAERVAALSDAEVASLHQRMDEVAAGGSVVGAIVFIFVLLLVTDILGLTKVFPFTRSVR
jgi:hypothetical protein